MAVTEREILTQSVSKDRGVSVVFTPEGRVSSGEFPKDPKKRYEALVNTFNSSIKARLFLLIPEIGEISAADLEKAFSVTESEAPVHLTSEAINQYMHKNFLPAGLVSERVSPPDGGNLNNGRAYYSLTEDGRKFGMDTAKLILNFENQQTGKVIDAFGLNTTSADSVKPPTLRSTMLFVLSKVRRPMRNKDIMERVGQSVDESTIRHALRKLSENGLVTHSTFGDTTYEICADSTIINLKGRSARHSIVEICQNLSRNNIPITVDNVRNSLRQEQLDRWKTKKELNISLREKLDRLANAKFLRITYLAKIDKKPLTVITKKGRQFVNGLIIPLMAIAGCAEEKNTIHRESPRKKLIREHLELISTMDLEEERKRALAAYCVLAENSFETTTKLLGITHDQLRKYIDMVNLDDDLIAIFDTLYPEEAYNELEDAS